MKMIFVILSLVVLCFPTNSVAVPVSPDIHMLTQPDGTVFKARQWGDEWLHGWETEEGYTIIFSEDLDAWTYAVIDKDGYLVGSEELVGGAFPQVPKHIRPDEAVLQTIYERSINALGTEITAPIVPTIGTGNIPVILINFNDRSDT